ncbi:MAG: hypothetical protein EA411_11030 [Saprospirales bacterium]|nr:MAG: hypothetical protein EA411_11030 [Saprospirales bacterium]
MRNQVSLPQRKYPAKLLFLGEYSVLSGSDALALPFRRFSGVWVQGDDTLTGQEKVLEPFIKYLDKLFDSDDQEAFLDLTKMKRAFEEGWRLKSSIPVGVGLGSSGMLCAAVYDAFATKKNSEPGQTHRMLQKMEAFFHGRSSGMDPLVSFLENPVLLQDKKTLIPKIHDTIENPPFFTGLLDSKIKRNTAALVPLYRKKVNEPESELVLKNDYIPSVNRAISAYLNHQPENLWLELRQISLFQYEFFEPMIPEGIRGIWQRGMLDETYYLKLCGAGGGGYFYVFSKKEETVKELPNVTAIVEDLFISKTHQ